jgi:hypothetical protein
MTAVAQRQPPVPERQPPAAVDEPTKHELNWKLAGAITALGLAALGVAAYVEEAGEDYWTGLLVEVGAALFLAAGLSFLGLRVVRPLRAQVADVRDAVARLEQSGPASAALASAREAVQADHGEQAKAVAAAGRAVNRMHAAFDRLDAALREIAHEVTRPEAGLSVVSRDASDVDQWRADAFGASALDDGEPPHRPDDAPGQQRGRELVITAHRNARVEWIASVQTCLRGDGSLQYTVGQKIEPINPLGRDAVHVSTQFAEEQANRRYGHRSCRSFEPAAADHDRQVQELAQHLRDAFGPCLDYFYRLSEWTAGYPEYRQYQPRP